VGTGFPKRSCSNKKMDDEHDSTQLNHALVLLRHKFHCDGLIDRVQHGHRDKRLTMATVSLRRRVAMEFGMWRSVLSGGAAGSIIFGKARRLEVRGGTRF